ncbi:cob(I)yrinic acid a,c-diamide adenosyltransferase [Tenacibaculum soleae]|mgnify:FL=1|uniref:Corrinoid adenosyltransferase n=1 Tax=Tenacibaculum soleae TaxID=447689 RepID=A0A1B9XWC4_9FLAO|nr:cob(I)yrinic acid a,c-diamide adenosyltransferase [Tenacibaculum soleae]MDO6745457.1 cob(I)yrinic acid a,c-diamide adenosyltransferase [Tenacibaculum soleae]MDO6813969.1 cob(I)yrinic acid a,c-diamide adenosyltransferase [Tenacibaculum soleae]OCK41858.1 ATP:cob(I)alamin adenosyltransferase [Tenacibaculum soleae]
MKIYTRKGDKGSTGVFGGKREFKNSARIECIGTLDEVNSTIGLMRSKLGNDHEWQPNLHRIQKDMMNMMSHLARPSDSKKVNPNPEPKDGAEFCEQWLDEMEDSISSPSDYFLLPGGNEISALCHVCRTQVRRGERQLVTLMQEDPECVHDYIMSYVNRMSDLFFTMARAEMDKHGVAEEKWNLFLYKRKKKTVKK